MPDEKHEYTVTTPHGDVNLTTAHHHSTFDDIESWLASHKETVRDALGLASLAAQGLGVYLAHNRAGRKLK